MTTTLSSDHRVDWNDLELEVKALSVNGVSITSTNSTPLTGITAGTAAASKALVLGASKEIATITTATITNLTTTTLTPTTIAGGSFSVTPVLGAATTIDLDSTTSTMSSNAGTITKYACVVTTESLSTAHTASQALTITGTGLFATGDLAFVSLVGGSNTGGIPLLKAVCSTSTCTVTISNMAKATDAFNGTFIFNLWVLKA